MCKKYFSILTPLCVLLLSGVLAFAQPGPGYQKYKDAETARKAKNYPEAIKKYDEALVLEDNNSRYYYRKGQCFLMMNDPAVYDKAIEAFEKCVQYDASITGAYVNIYKIYAKRKDANNAIKYLRLAFDKETNQQKKIKYKVLAAKYLLTLDKPADAMRELQDAKALKPDDINVLYTEGEINGRNGNWNQALESYNRALDIAVKAKYPENIMAKYKVGVGVAQYKLGHMPEYDKIANELKSSPRTKRYYQLLVRSTKGGGASLQLRLAMAYLKANEYDEAQKYANEAIKLGENLAQAYKIQGLIHNKAGEPNLAITAFGKAAAEVPNDEKELDKIHQTMVKLQFNNRDYSGALATANKILQKSSKSVSVMFLKAQSEYKLGRYEECITTCELCIKGSGGGGAEKAGGSATTAKYYFLMGLAAKKANKLDKAREAFSKAQVGVFKVAAREEQKGLGAK